MVKYKENETPEEQISTNEDDETETNDESRIINLLKRVFRSLEQEIQVSFLTTNYPLSICLSVNLCFHPFVNISGIFNFSKATGQI